MKLIQEIEKLFARRQFQSVAPNQDLSHNKYRITGANARWSKAPEIVYSYHLRLTGPKSEVVSWIESISDQDLQEIREKVNQSEKTYPFPGSKETLIETLITSNNHNTQKKSHTYTPAELFEHEKTEYSNYRLQLRKEEKNAPGVDEIYQAFLTYKKNQLEASKNPGKTLRNQHIGQIYTELQPNQVLSVMGYNANDGEVEVVELDPIDSELCQIHQKVLYRAPNYRIISGTKIDLEYALKDLSHQGAIELTPSGIKKTLRAWMEVKKRNQS